MSKALVVFSGGQDSTTCLFWAKTRFESVQAIAFDYGQRHRIELEAAKRIAGLADVDLLVYRLDLMSGISHNALTDQSMNVDREMIGNQPPNTLVEGRNQLFLTYAAIYAKTNGICDLVTGVGQADYSGYPDCRHEFIQSLTATLRLSMDYPFSIHTPLMWLDKSLIWRLSDELGILDLVRTETVTCYNGIKGDGCGACPSCSLRRKGLEKYLKEKQNG